MALRQPPTQSVQLVNLSIGTDDLYGDESACALAHPGLAAAVDNLNRAGVTVFAATGNRGSTTSISAPACLPGVIAVGATYDSAAGKQPPQWVGTTYAARWGAAFANCSDATSEQDQVACFTNSAARMDLLAPGAPIVSDSPGGGTDIYWGTSQAAPVAAGVAALMLQCAPGLSPSEIKRWLTETGTPVLDTRNGLTFPAIRADAAIAAACPKDDEPSTMDPADAGRPADAAVSPPQAGGQAGSQAGNQGGGGTTAGGEFAPSGGATGGPSVAADAGPGPVAAPVGPGETPTVAGGLGATTDAGCGCAVQSPASPADRGLTVAPVLLALFWVRRRRLSR